MKVRILWALIMIGVLVPFVMYANDIVFTLGATFLALIAITELLKAIQKPPAVTILFTYGFIIFSGWFSYEYGMLDSFYFIILFIVITVLLVLKQNLERYNFMQASVVYMVIVYVVFSFNALIFIKINYDLELFLYPVVLAVLADTFGYFGGKLLGKNKLIPNISPNKTIEGAIFATVAASVFSVVFLLKLNYDVKTVVIMTVLMVILSQIGDLVASTIKRTFNIKDYSNMIPGHGGIMDRMDSILFNYIVLSVILVYI